MEEREKNYRIAGIIVAVLVIGAGCWFLLHEPDVSDHRGTATDIRNELGNAGNAQRNAQEHLDGAGRRIDSGIERVDGVAERIDDVTDRIESVQDGNRVIAEIVSDSESRIAESRAILQGIRETAGQSGK